MITVDIAAGARILSTPMGTPASKSDLAEMIVKIYKALKISNT